MCPRCGANNFENVPDCWKCHAALASSGAPGLAPVFGTPQDLREPRVFPGSLSAPAIGLIAPGDEGAARRAAVLLALTMPWLGLPVGWIFIMMQDARRQAIGRFCVAWSFGALILHLLLLFVMAQSTARLFLSLLQPTLDSALKSGGRSDSLRSMDPFRNGP